MPRLRAKETPAEPDWLNEFRKEDWPVTEAELAEHLSLRAYGDGALIRHRARRKWTLVRTTTRNRTADPENSTQVAVLMDVADMEALTAAMQSVAAAQAMSQDGVVPESLLFLVEEHA